MYVYNFNRFCSLLLNNNLFVYGQKRFDANFTIKSVTQRFTPIILCKTSTVNRHFIRVMAKFASNRFCECCLNFCFVFTWVSIYSEMLLLLLLLIFLVCSKKISVHFLFILIFICALSVVLNTVWFLDVHQVSLVISFSCFLCGFCCCCCKATKI